MIEQIKNIGKPAIVLLDGLRIPVTIIDVRQAFGRIDYKIQPIGSPDSKYVDSTRVRIEG